MSANSFQFVDNSSIGRQSRRFIRSHVMKGKNAGKKRAPRAHQPNSTTSQYSVMLVPRNDQKPDATSAYHQGRSAQEWSRQDLLSPRVLFNVGDELGRFASPYHVSDQDRRNISQFLLRFSEMVYPPQFSIGIRTSKSIFVEYLFLDEAFCFGYVTNGQCIARSELHHHLHALRLLNTKLASHHALSEISIASVIALCLLEYLKQDANKMRVHFQGLLRMIELRGGISSLVAYPALMDKVRRLDIDIAVQLGVPLHLGFMPTLPQPSISSSFLSDYEFPATFGRAFRDSSGPLYFVARDIARMARFMTAVAGAPNLGPGVFQENLMSLFYRLLDIDTVVGDRLEDPLAAAMHVVLVAFMTLALARFLEVVADHPEAHFWMLMVAGGSILDESAHCWLVRHLQEIGRIMTKCSLPLSLTSADCAGKIYIVTGANSGLGLECVKHLVRLGSKKVIMTVRSRQRGQDALSLVESETGVKGVAELWDLDVSNFDSIKKFVSKVEGGLERLDGLINNAAAANGSWSVAEGMESSIAANVVGTILTTVLMMPYLRVCAKQSDCAPQVSFVTSGMAWTCKSDLAKIDRNRGILNDVNDSSKWDMDGVNRYALSKLLQVLAVRRFAQLAPVQETGVTLNLVNPGLCNTGLIRYYTLSTKIITTVLRLAVGRSAEWGSRSLLFGMAAGEESHGKYLSYCEITEKWVPEWVDNQLGQQWASAIWDEVALELEKVQSGCVNRALSA
ncbi:hypothetical protein F66182_7695 [Fusarium sp. NRRL 66182]|nr:hypothetical protein F66182_7695 [Fusarium sp. NRRL 66182]